MSVIQQQGRFTSTGAPVVIPLPAGVDWMRVYNYTVALNDQTTAIGVEYYWQRGMPDGRGLEYLKSNAAAAANLEQVLAANTGFFLVDSNSTQLGPQVAVTASSVATQPVVNTGNTAGLSVGSVIMLQNLATGASLAGYPFTISAVSANTNFTIAATLATSQASIGAGFYRIVKYPPLFQPSIRYIANVVAGSVAGTADVTTTTPSNFQVGQIVRFTVPKAGFGMTQLDTLEATVITAPATTSVITELTFTVNLDVSAFTTFTFPTNATVAANGMPFGKAIVEPVGMDNAEALGHVPPQDQLSDATRNIGIRGMLLAAGANSPAGQASDIIYWHAGISDTVENS